MVESAWDEILQVLAASPYPVTVLPPDHPQAESCLAELGITTRSWLGALAWNTGGLLIDHGWLRVFGSGAEGMPDILSCADPSTGGLVVAWDVLGGQFAWIQAEPDCRPTVHYFGPDLLEWQDLGQGYSDWLYAVLAGSLTQFYENLRWPGWEVEVAELSLSDGIHTWPPPSTVEGQDLSVVSRRAVPMAELISFHLEFAQQLH